ncbi:Eukaryotic translation initiation factor 4E-4 [Sarcoptes scabiei]|uniref:Eukaryotic translation initiation factor NCBP n=1 Tax=Sarcoptes scabiei TaxID=52283 RepID=A0A834RGI9_SARSC|nr:Eukaryotic translation initiation factor 4E-4 [Sarcoptes scabiei]
MHYHYTSGLQFLLEQTQQNKDWPSYLRMLPMVANELLEQTFRSARVSVMNGQMNHQNDTFSSYTDDHCQRESKNLSNMEIWQLWRWKPPLKSSLQSKDDYFSNSATTPHEMMHEFRKHLTISKDLKFTTNDLRRLAAIEFQPLMTFVTQDDYDDHTDSIVRSYFIFKDGVMPLWEDEYNAFGGCWSLIWNNDQLNDKNSKKNSKYVWKKLINVLTDPILMNYVDELCGAGLTIRSNKTYKLTIWNRNSDDTITKMIIGQAIQSILNHHGPMFYYSHKSTLQNQYQRKKLGRARRRVFKSNQACLDQPLSNHTVQIPINNHQFNDQELIAPSDDNRRRSFNHRVHFVENAAV